MRCNKIICLIVGVFMLFSIALVGCDATSPYDFYNTGNNTDGNITVAGIDKDDVYTWFDMNKTDLPDRHKCEKIKVGMSLNEVIGEIGKPQRDIGYGACLFQFDLADGAVLTVTFVQDSNKIKNDPNISDYDSLTVAHIDFEQEIPDIIFPYCGPLHHFYPWINELNVEDIVQVRYEQAFIGVAPGSLKSISSTTNSADIENSYRLLFSNLKEIGKDEGQVCGGGYVKYDFLTANNKTYSIKVSNNRLFINDRYYKFVGNFYYKFQHADINCYSFDTSAMPSVDKYEVYTYATDGVKVGDYDGLGELEFCIYDGLIEHVPSYYVKTAFDVNLVILSSNRFMIAGDDSDVVYQITSEKDFSSLFEDSNA